jgi:cytochrome P450
VTVICEMLGIPRDHHEMFLTSARESGRLLDPVPLSRAELDAANAHNLAAAAYFQQLFELRRREPGDDLTTRLVQAEEQGNKLTNEELTANIILLFGAGHETTVNLIGNGTLALLRNRDQFEALAADPALDGNAADELLRYDTPVHISRRIAMTDMEVAGETVHRGELIVTLLAAANHDPARSGPTAGRLDVRREGAGAHLSFGSGIHHCLGAALARLEGAEALGALVRRFPAMELATDAPDWNGRVILRGLDTLAVAV